MSTDNKIRIGITHGDINGISYELILKTFVDSRMLEICTPIVYGSPKVAAYHRKAIDMENFTLNSIRNADEANDKRLNIINVADENVRVELGKPSQLAGDAAYQALERAVADLKNKKIDVLVTCPIHKASIQSEAFNFPGHTEYLEAQFGGKAVMLMVGQLLRIGVVAGHMPLVEVPGYITQARILEKLQVLHRGLTMDFSIRKPQIAVLGLNPHAGEEGLLGKEEQQVIIPAIEKARENGIMAHGPFAADGFFGAGTFKKFDAILAMYHDQGLIPFKAIEFEAGVNYTCGLPVIRTSPAHGTAYEIAGKNEADPSPFRHAIYLAIEGFNSRTTYAELAKDPLYPNEVV